MGFLLFSCCEELLLALLCVSGHHHNRGRRGAAVGSNLVPRGVFKNQTSAALGAYFDESFWGQRRTFLQHTSRLATSTYPNPCSSKLFGARAALAAVYDKPATLYFFARARAFSGAAGLGAAETPRPPASYLFPLLSSRQSYICVMGLRSSVICGIRVCLCVL